MTDQVVIDTQIFEKHKLELRHLTLEDYGGIVALQDEIYSAMGGHWPLKKFSNIKNNLNMICSIPGRSVLPGGQGRGDRRGVLVNRRL